MLLAYMKKGYLVLIVIGVLIVGWLFIRFVIGGSEDSWIKDERGVYVEHGKPAEIPDYVREQQEAVLCALNLYEQKRAEGMQFSSQCLGACGNYAVDVVHVPRNGEDNNPENQCEDYREGRVRNFIELDKEGDIVRVV